MLYINIQKIKNKFNSLNHLLDYYGLVNTILNNIRINKKLFLKQMIKVN
jgi:hypothetical protein